MPQYLVLFDADHIKDYVFTSGRLKEIRGASDIVRELTDEKPLIDAFASYGLQPWSTTNAPARVIYAAGGAGALLFADATTARAFCADLERAYRRRTRSASLSAIVVEVAYDTPAAQAVAQSEAALLLRRRKDGRPQAEELPGGGVLRFCASDRLRPAITRAPDPDGQGILVSEATARKRLQNYQYRKRFAQQPFWQEFERLLHPDVRVAWRDAISDSQDLGTIGAQATPRGYVALVYADGDGVGRLLRKIVGERGFDGYHEFSAALALAATRATAQALAAAYGRSQPEEQPYSPDRLRDDAPNQATLSAEAPTGIPATQVDLNGAQQRFLPFEVITIGGDDVVLICTAERGLEVACALSHMFSQLVNQLLADYEAIKKQPFSASVGVVLAHDSLPIVQLEHRGRELLRSAKQASEPPGIDFHIVTTPSLDRIGSVRSRDYGVGRGQAEHTRKPYTLRQAEILLEHARHLCGLSDHEGTPRHQLMSEAAAKLPFFPGSKRADLYAACRGERLQATLDVLTVHQRLSEPTRKALLQALRDLDSIAAYPFGAPDRGVYRTALPDLIEILEFVAEEGRWGSM